MCATLSHYLLLLQIVNVWYSVNGERLGTYTGHTGAVWCVDADCILVFALSLCSQSLPAIERLLELGIWGMIVGLENNTCLLFPGLFTGWGNI